MKANGMNNNGGFDAWAHSLLAELEQQTPEAIRAQRSSERQSVKVGVAIHPSNASDKDAKPAVDGVTGDVSGGGCRLMTDRPLLVGDVYRLHFEKSEVDLPIVFARCVRCRLVHEDAFESGFSFFEKIDLTSPETTTASRGLL